jgi:alpha-beta hydrolase superfamily lysophospholipase
VHRGLDLTFPALVLSSSRSSSPTELGDDVHSTDIVLDVEQIRRWSSSIGRHVTYVGVEGARHDVFLSLAEPRARAFDELGRWLAAYVES